MSEEELRGIRQREVQAIGAALSTRNWHDCETAYNSLRDKLDAMLLARPQPATDDGLVEKIIRDICELSGEYDLEEDQTVMLVNAEDLTIVLERNLTTRDDQIAALRDEMREKVIHAFIAGAEAVHNERLDDNPYREPDFTEAAHDYARSALETGEAGHE